MNNIIKPLLAFDQGVLTPYFSNLSVEHHTVSDYVIKNIIIA